MAALFPFKTEKEVVDLANDTDVGLAAYFFSRDYSRIWRVAEALEGKQYSHPDAGWLTD